MNKKGILFMPIVIAIVIAVLILILLIKAPQICILNNCFRIVPLRWGKALMFWIMFLAFFLIVTGIIYAYYWILSNGIRYAKGIMSFVKLKTTSIEQYFLKISG